MTNHQRHWFEWPAICHFDWLKEGQHSEFVPDQHAGGEEKEDGGEPGGQHRRDRAALAQRQSHGVKDIIEKSDAHRDADRRERHRLAASGHERERQSHQDDDHVAEGKGDLLMKIHLEIVDGPRGAAR